MDCDISIINSGQDDETVFDNDSPQKTVKMIDEAQLTNAAYTKDTQLKFYLKKIQAASKIQEYLLEKSIPTSASHEEKAIINHDLLKLSKYISKCCTHCLKTEAGNTPMTFTRAKSTSSHKGPGQPAQLPTDGSTTKRSPMLPTPAHAHAHVPHTPKRVEKVTSTLSNSPSTPSTLVANNSFDRLFMKLMSPSSKSKSCEKKGADGSSDRSSKQHMTSSVARKLYSDDESELEIEPPISNTAPDCRVIGESLHTQSDELSSSIEDWSQVKQYIPRSRSQTPSPAPVPPSSPPPSSTEEPPVSFLAAVSREVEKHRIEDEQVLPGTNMTNALSMEGFSDCDEWEEQDQGADSRPPSPPPEMEEEVEEYVDPAGGSCEVVATTQYAKRQEECEEKVVDLRVDLTESLDVSCDGSLPSSLKDSRSGNGNGSGSDGSSTDSLRFSDDSPLPQPRQQASPLPKPVPSPSLVVGRPELTWSTEFGSGRGTGSSQQHQPASTYHVPRKKLDQNSGITSSKHQESTREVAINKDLQYTKETPTGSNERVHEAISLRGLRRNSPSKESYNRIRDGGNKPDVQHASPRRGLGSSRHMTPPMNNTLQIPGNHLNLRNSLKLAQVGTRHDN